MRRLFCALLAATLVLFLPANLEARKPAPPRYSLAELSPAESRARPGDPRLALTGIHRAVESEAAGQGAWEAQADGTKLWRLALRSPGAAAVRLQFTGFAAGDGAVWLRDPQAPEQAVGPYTGAGPMGDGEFWSGTVFGDEVVVEFSPGRGQQAGGSPPFQIARLSHRLPQTSRPDLSGALGLTEAPCHLDVTCYPEWSEAAASVALILMETVDGQTACTGTLLRTRSGDNVPYLLTAGHCVEDSQTARSVEAFWGYQSSVCNGTPAELKGLPRTPVGSKFLKGGNLYNADFALLLLPSVPGVARSADWDPAEKPIGAPLTAIHHPAATHKRISFGERYYGYWMIPLPPDELYYATLWKRGILEHGSSGSPLFTDARKLTGVLSYGFEFTLTAYCQVNPFICGYGRFSAIYPWIQSYINGRPESDLSVAPDKVEFQLQNGVLTSAAKQTVVVGSASREATPFTAGADVPWVVLSTQAGRTVAGAPAAIDVSIQPNLVSRKGEYTGTVLVRGAGFTRSLKVVARANVVPSAVTIKVEPNPVPAQTPDAQGCRWQFRVALQETAGVPTRFSFFQVNGQDYSAQIPAWFGSDRLNASGGLEARLRGCGTPGEQLMEFAGEDPLTGVTWNQSLTVTLAP